MIKYKWDPEKNELLKHSRGVCFEQVVMHIEQGKVMDIVDHPNHIKYPRQQILVVNIRNYIYLVPLVEVEDERFLKTIIPSRKATRRYLERT